MISIIIPSYGRADKAQAVYVNATANTDLPHEVVFVVEREQEQAYETALWETNAHVYVNERSRNYAGAVNTAIETCLTDDDTDYFFLGADDVNFHRGWDENALQTMEALDHIKVVGTNDLWNDYVLKGWHATHYLVSRDYLRQPGGVVDGMAGHALFEGYDHNFTDTEFIGTAKARAVFAPCLTSVVEHLHWTAGKSEKDLTSEKAYREIQKDRDLYESRKELWWGLSK